MKTVRVELKIPETTLKKIDKIASVEFETRSTIIRNALRDYLDKKLLMIDTGK